MIRKQGIYDVPTLSIFIWADEWGDPPELLTDPFLPDGVEERVIGSLRGSRIVPAAPAAKEDRAALFPGK
jgi:hypothetical protein